MVAGMVFTWPSFCGNLFPCHSHPTDGTTFELSLSGVPQGLRAIYPTSIPAEAPAYMLSWAVGRYEQLDLGRTSAGTQVDVWFFPEHRADAVTGSRHLREAFDWLERTYGPYLYGDRVAGGARAPMEAWSITPSGTSRPTPWTVRTSRSTRRLTVGSAMASASAVGRIWCSPRV
jgi:hypothetical protein